MGLRTAHLQCPCSTEVSFHHHHKQGISWTMKWSTCSQAAIWTNMLCMKLTEIFLPKRMVSTEDALRMEAKEGEINLGGVEKDLPDTTRIHLKFSYRHFYIEKREVHREKFTPACYLPHIHRIWFMEQLLLAPRTLLVEYSPSWRISHFCPDFN